MRDPNIKEFVAIDFETTGLSPLEDRVIEVGALRFDLSGREIASMESLVASGKRSHPRAFAVHGISEADLADAPPTAVVMARLLAFLGEPNQTVLLAHNASFDAAFLGAELARSELAQPAFAVIDTLPLARQAFPDFRSHGLDSLSRRLGFDRSDAHRALSDCRRVKALWMAIAGQIEPSGSRVSTFRVTKPDAVSVAPDGWDELVRATRDSIRVRLTYAGGTRGTGPREITPRRFANRGGITYLVSFCHLDGREKNFRLDRVLQYELIETAVVG